MSIATLLSSLAVVPESGRSYTVWIVAGLIVLVGLAVIGLRDVARFSLKRTWAISSVCFAESIRRKVWLIIPLAILGVIIVVQLQKPLDEQDAIRQTTKFCLFATGLVVAMVTIILAATNLPREIENRVIYTVVTKPTTRLEIVLGKVVGFARVSAAILLAMGLFTFGYVQVRAWSMRQYIREVRLKDPAVTASLRPTLQYYAANGLLGANTLEHADSLAAYSRIPTARAADTGARWISGGAEQEVTIPFDVKPEQITTTVGGELMSLPVHMYLSVGYEAHGPITSSESYEEPATEPTTLPTMGPTFVPAATQAMGEATTAPAAGAPAAGAPATTPADAVTPQAMPQVSVSISETRTGRVIASLEQLTGGKPLSLRDSDGSRPVAIELPASVVGQIAADGKFTVLLQGLSANAEYLVPPIPVVMAVGRPDGTMAMIPPILDEKSHRPAGITFRGREGSRGTQLRGGTGGPVPWAVFTFHDSPVSWLENGKVPFEFRVGIERSGADVTLDEDDITRVTVKIRNLRDGTTSAPIELRPDNNRTSYFDVPAELLTGGQFEALVQCNTVGHWLWLNPASLSMVSGREPFAWNLSKSLLILWLMSVLVVIISIFCSTFVSWPIAIVLTLVILMGRWGVQQLGDALQPGIGNTIVTDMRIRDAASGKAVSQSVEALAGFLRNV